MAPVSPARRFSSLGDPIRCRSGGVDRRAAGSRGPATATATATATAPTEGPMTTETAPDPAPAAPAAAAPPAGARLLRRRLEGLLGIAATEGNLLTPLRNGDEIFPAMLEAVDGARRTVDLMTFVYWRGDIARVFARSLARKAAQGVRVRLLLDGFGSRLIEPELTDL